jgi:hypothetical protein
MLSQKIALAAGEQRQPKKTFRVVILATKTAPLFEEKGLADVAGKVPVALGRFGVASKVIVPLYAETRQALVRLDLEKHLTGISELETTVGGKKYAGRADRLDLRHHQIDFISQGEMFDRSHMYGWDDDLLRSVVFCRLSLQLERKLGAAAEVYDCLDWQNAVMPFLRKYHTAFGVDDFQDDFFRDSRLVVGIHDFQYQGGFSKPNLEALGLGRNGTIPLDIHRYFNALEQGLACADRSYARSLSYLDKFASQSNICLARLARESIANRTLVGLWPDDRLWSPDRELNDTAATGYAQGLLGVYRSVAARPLDPVIADQARQTSPEVAWQAKTPRETLRALDPEQYQILAAAYDQLPWEDRDLVEQEIGEGRAERFAGIKSKRELDGLLGFLRIRPVHDLEGRLRSQGALDFLDAPNGAAGIFYPGDINRLLASPIDVSASTSVKLAKLKSVSVYEALEKIGELSHVVKLFESFRLMAEAQEIPASELRARLAQRGQGGDDGAPGITAEASRFLLLSAVLHRLRSNLRVFKAFIIEAILHDSGKCLDFDQHGKKGVNLLKELKALEALLDSDQIDFVRKILRYHSTFGDSAAIKEQHPSFIVDLFFAYKDREARNLFLDALFIIGIADMDASEKADTPDKGWLSNRNVRHLSDLYHALVQASDTGQENDLKNIVLRNLAAIGLGLHDWGNSVWNHFIVRETDIRGLSSKKAAKHFSDLKQAARRELHVFLKFYDRAHGTKMSEDQFKTKLGANLYTFQLQNIFGMINEAKFRARLLCLLEYLLLQQGQTRLHLQIGREESTKLLDTLGSPQFDYQTAAKKFACAVIETEEDGPALKITI